MDLELVNKELKRCLGCKVQPCFKACPLGVSPHDFIIAAKNGDYQTAASQIAYKNPLPQTCGLICPDTFCQKACIRAKIDSPIEIPCLQAYIMQKGGLPPLSLPAKNNKKVAVIGGGPAGIGALYELLMLGFNVDIYDKSEKLGGCLRLIPDYRLPKSVLDNEIKRLTENDRVKIHTNSYITDFDTLKSQYDGIILALGEILPRSLNIPGEEQTIAYADYLFAPENYNSAKHGKVAVIGGGEVALDCALTLRQQGYENVEMFVRRRNSDMRIMKKDHISLENQNVKVNELTSITNIQKQENDYKLTIIHNEINENGKAQALPNTEEIVSGYTMLVMALGSYYPKDKLPENILSCGDMTGLCGTCVQAIASGKTQAKTLSEEIL